MEIGKLTVSARDSFGKGTSRQLRLKGLVPGVCYGAGLSDPLPITVDPKALKASLDPDKRRNTVIDLTIQTGDKSSSVTAMIWDYQIHPIKRNVTHVDLKAIDPDIPVEAHVPLVLVGRAKGLVNGGQLNVARHSLDIIAKPADIPGKLELDVTELDLGDVLHVSDLKIPEGVKLATSQALTIVTCLAPKVSAADEAAEAADAEAVEGAEGGDAAAASDAPNKEGDA